LLSKYCPSYKVVEVNLERDGGRSTQEALFKLTGQYTFPNTFIEGKSVGGFDSLSELDRQGELNNICKKQ
jgi:glutaredoxin